MQNKQSLHKAAFMKVKYSVMEGKTALKIKLSSIILCKN